MTKETASILGSWGMTTVYCGNPSHGELLPLELREERKQFIYACPHYEDKNCPCRNMININDFQKMLGHISDIIVESSMSGCEVNMTNFSWKDRNRIRFKILEHSPGKMEVTAYNENMLGREKS